MGCDQSRALPLSHVLPNCENAPRSLRCPRRAAAMGLHQGAAQRGRGCCGCSCCCCCSSDRPRRKEGRHRGCCCFKDAGSVGLNVMVGRGVAGCGVALRADARRRCAAPRVTKRATPRSADLSIDPTTRPPQRISLVVDWTTSTSTYRTPESCAKGPTRAVDWTRTTKRRIRDR